MSYYPQAESATLELKERIPENDQIVKTVVAFCNLFGGRLVLGVDDARRVIGIAERDAERLLEYLDKTIYESCSPPIMPDIYTERVGDKLLLNVRVSPGMQKPYFVRSLGLAKGVYVRLGRSTVRADEGTIEELRRQNLHISFDATAVYSARPEDVDREAFAAFARQRRVGHRGKASIETLKAYHLLVEEQSHLWPSVGGLLLFNREPQRFFSEAFIICTRFAANDSRRVLATQDASGNLFQQFDLAFDFVASSMSRSFRILDKRRQENYEIPMVAVREALLNAIVHRNYRLPGPIKLAIYPDRVEIFSPGTFPGPIDVSHLTSGVTYIRNGVIAKVFREAGYVEKLGTGFITIFDSYRNMGLKEPAIIEGENFVKCILPREKASATPTSDEDAVMRLLLARDTITVLDVMSGLGVSRASAGRRLRALELARKLARVGRGPATRYERMG